MRKSMVVATSMLASVSFCAPLAGFAVAAPSAPVAATSRPEVVPAAFSADLVGGRPAFVSADAAAFAAIPDRPDALRTGRSVAADSAPR